MGLISGKSSNKIVHYKDCRYVKMIPAKNKKHFLSLEEATEDGYVQCKYCARIRKYINKEMKEMTSFCESKGIDYRFNPIDGSIDIESKLDKWKIIVSGAYDYIWLYHKNSTCYEAEGTMPGYHSQNVCCTSLMGYMDYIARHDRFRRANPLHDCSRQGRSNRILKQRLHQKIRQMRKKQNTRYFLNMMDMELVDVA